MSKFVKPTWIDRTGWNEGLRIQTITVNHYATVGLTLEGGGESLRVAPNDPSVAKVAEQAKRGGLRVFRVTGTKVGHSMLEAKNSAGKVLAFMQIKVKGQPGAKRIVVDLAQQKLEAYEGKEKVFAFECVTGAADHPTLPGVFNISRKDKIHRSHKYNAQMNYAMFFSADGKAIHQYHGPGPLWAVRTLKSGVSDWFGSHGCVRLTEKDAMALFNWAPIGTKVEIR